MTRIQFQVLCTVLVPRSMNLFVNSKLLKEIYLGAFIFLYRTQFPRKVVVKSAYNVTRCISKGNLITDFFWKQIMWKINVFMGY